MGEEVVLVADLVLWNRLLSLSSGAREHYTLGFSVCFKEKL